MSLLDSLQEFTASAPATKNRVEILLDRLAGTEDLPTLSTALRNPAISGSTLTKALRKEYGHTVVTDNSVGEWRRRNLSELTGL